jgi:tetratricopeptide (TPR) repeat protein
MDRRVSGRGLARLAGLCAASLAFWSCAAKVADPGPGPRLVEMRQLVACGSHSCLERAAGIGRALRAAYPESAEVRDALLEASLLLGVRERRLAILGDAHLTEARAILATCPDCERWTSLADLAELTPVPGAGVVSDALIARQGDAYITVRERGEDWVRLLAPDLEGDATAAILALVLRWFQPRGGFVEETQNLPERHAGAPGVQLEAAFAFLNRQGELAEKALELEPSFTETHLVLGQQALGERDYGVAERELREARGVFPRSVSAQLGLGDALFAMEEHAEALPCFDRVLELAPDHRDALLRKGMSWSMLGRHEDAIGVLDRLLGLGHWNAGEARYWLAWNHRELGRGAEAEAHVVEARRLLSGNVAVHGLAGEIAFEAEDVPAAVERLGIALHLAEDDAAAYAGHDAVCSAQFTRSRIHHQQGELGDALHRFGAAADCRGTAAVILERAIARVETGSLSAERKERAVRRKRRQRETELLKEAAARYNAAVSAVGLGDAETARRFAAQAGRHPRYADLAGELEARLR